ncbi:unnamed protein product [Protopolystoma xenopodis]|uniref:Uncharacterized protein n=1 Tax=Protopolystoma xenopodis TaxID=117903 RepID=A0A3S5AT00_9PLAT|nr:unnamed protein product [Protopolystoma xenopodis]
MLYSTGYQITNSSRRLDHLRSLFLASCLTHAANLFSAGSRPGSDSTSFSPVDIVNVPNSLTRFIELLASLFGNGLSSGVTAVNPTGCILPKQSCEVNPEAFNIGTSVSCSSSSCAGICTSSGSRITSCGGVGTAQTFPATYSTAVLPLLLGTCQSASQAVAILLPPEPQPGPCLLFSLSSGYQQEIHQPPSPPLSPQQLPSTHQAIDLALVLLVRMANAVRRAGGDGLGPGTPGQWPLSISLAANSTSSTLANCVGTNGTSMSINSIVAPVQAVVKVFLLNWFIERFKDEKSAVIMASRLVYIELCLPYFTF